MEFNERGIETLIFLDLETSGLPRDHIPKITEISMCAISRKFFEDHSFKITSLDSDVMPRVVNRQTLCVYPQRIIYPDVTRVTGLDNWNLQHQRPFDLKVFSSIRTFIELHDSGPVCLVAHNGDKFDFPILKTELDSIGQSLPDDLLCVDSLKIFKELVPMYDALMGIEMPGKDTASAGTEDLPSTAPNPNPFQLANEKTPERQMIRSKTVFASQGPSFSNVQVRRRLVYQETARSLAPRQRFALKDLYHKFYGEYPEMLHTAEADVNTLLKTAFAMPQDFVEKVDERATPFNQVQRL